MLSLTAPEDADVGEEFTVSANVLPTIVENKAVTWTYDEGLTKVSESEDSITLRAETPGEYKIKAVTVAVMAWRRKSPSRLLTRTLLPT